MTTDADRLGFESVGEYSPASQKNNIQDDNSPERRIVKNSVRVALLYKGQEIHLRDIEFNRQGIFTGKVFEFSNVCSMQFEGIKLGQKVSFRYLHIQYTF